MADGTTKRIDEIEVGDEVAASEPESASVERRAVVAVIVTDDDKEYVDLTVSTPAGPKVIRTTAHHPFFNATLGEWEEAGNLEAGNLLSTPGNGQVGLTAVHRYSAKMRTFNLTVENVHTYYVVVGQTPVLVHNAGGKEPEVPNAILRRIEEIKAGQAQPRLNQDGTGPDVFQVRNNTPGAHARKWGPSSPTANDAAVIYDMGDGKNRYRILVNRYGDYGWVDNHEYKNIRPYKPGC